MLLVIQWLMYKWNIPHTWIAHKCQVSFYRFISTESFIEFAQSVYRIKKYLFISTEENIACNLCLNKYLKKTKQDMILYVLWFYFIIFSFHHCKRAAFKKRKSKRTRSCTSPLLPTEVPKGQLSCSNHLRKHFTAVNSQHRLF